MILRFISAYLVAGLYIYFWGFFFFFPNVDAFIQIITFIRSFRKTFSILFKMWILTLVESKIPSWNYLLKGMTIFCIVFIFQIVSTEQILLLQVHSLWKYNSLNKYIGEAPIIVKICTSTV